MVSRLYLLANLIVQRLAACCLLLDQCTCRSCAMLLLVVGNQVVPLLVLHIALVARKGLAYLQGQMG